MAKTKQPAPVTAQKTADPANSLATAQHHRGLAPAEQARRIMQFLKTSDARLSNWHGNKRALTRQMKVLQRVVGHDRATSAMNAYLQRQRDMAAADALQRQEIDEEKLLQGKVAANETPVQRQDVDGDENRTGMPDRLKTSLEQLSGFDLSDVRVHHDSPKPAEVDALAYAQGRDIHLGPGQEPHLPHEGWHVVQQIQGRVKPTMEVEGVAINDDEGLEREADVMGARALERNHSAGSHSEVHPDRGIVGMSSQPVQRKFGGDLKKITYTEIRSHLAKFYQNVPNQWKIDQLANHSDIYSSLTEVAGALELKLDPKFKDSDVHIAKKEKEEEKKEEEDLRQSPVAFDEYSEKREKYDDQALKSFATTGLLLRTLDPKRALAEVEGSAPSTIEEGLDAQKEKSDIPQGNVRVRRNWSLAHEKLPPNYYQMDADAKDKGRHMAILSDPMHKGMKDRYLGFHAKDATSSGTLHEYEKLLFDRGKIYEGFKSIFEVQSKKEDNVNSEINTLGSDPDAIVGLLYNGTDEDWSKTHKEKFQIFFDSLCSGLAKSSAKRKNKKINVYKFKKTKSGTELILFKELESKKSDSE